MVVKAVIPGVGSASSDTNGVQSIYGDDDALRYQPF